MKRFAGITAVLSLALIAGMLCSCHDPSGTTVSSGPATEVSSETATASSSTSETGTITETTTETASVATSNTSTTLPTNMSEIRTTVSEIVETRKAMGKFNYVLKNKSWKYDGEMYYRKYKDGTTAYYDKEAKKYFLIDKKGQGWYYDPDIKDFVLDE